MDGIKRDILLALSSSYLLKSLLRLVSTVYFTQNTRVVRNAFHLELGLDLLFNNYIVYAKSPLKSTRRMPVVLDP